MLCRLENILSQIENIFRNGWDHFCEGGDWTAANHRLYAVTYDHIFHKYELHKEMNNNISRPYVECRDCQIFIILHKNYDYEYMILTRDEPGLIWLRYWHWPGRSCRCVGSCWPRLGGPGWAGLLSSYSGCRECGAGAWSRARTRHITHCSVLTPALVTAHCLTQLASVTQCSVSPVITKWLDSRKIWTMQLWARTKLMLHAVTLNS